MNLLGGKFLKKDLRSMTREELSQEINHMDMPNYRVNQIFEWVSKGVSFEEMTNLSKEMRKQLSERFTLSFAEVRKKQVSKDGTEKFLFQLPDGKMVESVLMRYKHGASICISTQIGCAMGCSFCASGLEGLDRNLSAGEMLSQILSVTKEIDQRIANVVLMGSGEPLQNLKEVVKLLNIVNDEKGLNISMRHITISTCGLVPQIYQLADLKLPVNLAISLHAASDTIRRSIMPIALKFSIADTLKACDYYIEKTNRRITFEYALIPGLNDHEEEIRTLADHLRNKLCHVNFIPVNPVNELFSHSKKGDYRELIEILRKHKIPATIRRELGADIDAACGQLKQQAKYKD
ncbi:23S rRNA m(2)A-2503 methyltransferase [Tindallia californiensis]|uniref:Probable dual-specificity RNA methyltransferase RlmN n=1 Tax=Tindallia californiensis TaxID=159292 RepID=A0A1H3NUS8_9FIRM|nr:23S rRNA m(2)A-2503 methyltransferase [Tindallia californiensis]